MSPSTLPPPPRRRGSRRRSRLFPPLPVCLLAVACLLGGCGLLGGPPQGSASGQREHRGHSAEATASPSGAQTEGARLGATPTGTATTERGASGASGGAGGGSVGAPEAVASGEYQPATKEHPARNVPTPQEAPEFRERTDAGARAAVTAWVEGINYGVQTGDTAPMEALAEDEPTLNPFEASWYWVPQVYQQGDWLVGGLLTMAFAEDGVSTESPTTRVVDFSYSFDGASRASSRPHSGVTLYVGSDAPSVSHARVEYVDGAWHLRSMWRD